MKKLFKPTSIVFMIIAGVLIISGVVLCIVGGSMAKKQNVELFAENRDEAGNAVSCRSLGGGTVKSLSIDLDGGKIKLIGGAKKNEVRLINYAENSFDYSVTGNEMVLKEAGIFTAFNFISEAGGNFNGLRHYLVMNRFKDEDKVVEVYISDTMTSLAKVDIKLEKGDVSVEGFNIDCSCNISVGEGNVIVKETESKGKYDIEIANGDIIYENAMVSETEADVTENGNISCVIDTQYSFTLETKIGMIFLEGENIGKSYGGVYPAKPIKKEEITKKEDTEEKDTEKDTEKQDTENGDPETEKEPKNKLPMIFFGKTVGGDITVKTEVN